MNKEKCKFYMDLFFQLDKSQILPAKLCFHLITCKSCRSQVRALTLAERTCSASIKKKKPLDNENLLNIMKKIDSSYQISTEIKPVSLKRWIISGVLMVIALFGFSFFNIKSINDSISISFYLVFASIITIYCIMFVIGNMDFFIKQIDKIPEKYLKKMDIQAL